jgi:hypothetical protein
MASWLCLLLVCPGVSAQDTRETINLKYLKLFPDKYEGKTVVLENVQYMHRIERQHDRFTFHVSNGRDTFVFMLKEVVKSQEGIAMITSADRAAKLVDTKLDGLPRRGQGWYPVNLTCRVEQIKIEGKNVWVANVSRWDFLDGAGRVARTIE